MTYIELCAGGGGMRLGLERAGWQNIRSIDISPEAMAIHRGCFGDGEVRDVKDVSSGEFAPFDALVAGFPCQPFSSCGPRLGFEHPSGNVFENIARIIAGAKPRYVILENVRGLLNHKKGSTFGSILGTLTLLGYTVEWLLLDLSWLGVPQTRPRVFIVAHSKGLCDGRGPANLKPRRNSREPLIFAPLVQRLAITCAHERVLKLSSLRDATKARNSKIQAFGEMGVAVGDSITTWQACRKNAPLFSYSLGRVVAPEFPFPDAVRSIRYYARGKRTKLHIRDTAVSHCVGNIPGSAPMFCVPLAFVRDQVSRACFLRDSNWHREEGDYLVMRMAPQHAVRLFGPETDRLASAIAASKITLSNKYIVVANLVAPICATVVGSLVAERAKLN